MIPAANAYKYVIDRYPIKKSTNGWWTSDCPFCGKRGKLAFHFAWSYAKCWSCEWRDSIVDLVMEVEDLSYPQAVKEIMSADGEGIDPEIFTMARSSRVVNMELPTGYTSLLDGQDRSMGRRAIRYLEGRGFDIEKLDRMGIGYCAQHDEEKESDYFGYIIVPIKKDGKLQYYIGRDFMDGFPRYKNPKREVCGVGKDQVIFNGDALDLYSTVYVLEGWTDALTLGNRACATLGWSWSREQLGRIIESGCKKVVVVADKGFYEQAVHNALKLLDHKTVLVVNLDGEDEGKDVNDIGRERTMELIKKTPKLTYEMAFSILGA